MFESVNHFINFFHKIEVCLIHDSNYYEINGLNKVPYILYRRNS